MSASNINLYTTQTPNGLKASIALEELGLKYEVRSIALTKNEQKEPWFLQINPNGRIPALVDTLENGQQIKMWESGAILVYLADRYDKDHKMSYPHGSVEYYEVLNWVFWQHGGLGPMQGQANHFTRYAPEKIQYGMDRYQKETKRLYSVLETQLTKSTSGFLVGDRLTIADIVSWGWVAAAGWAGVDIEEFPKLKDWEERLIQRPAFEKGRHVPDKHTMKEMLNDPKKMEEQATKARAWIMESNK